MSDYKVPYTRILDIQPHNNADRLEIATVYGFQVVVSKGRYKAGDKVIYVPIDSILPQNLEDHLFPYTKDAAGNLVPPKIKLDKHRVRQIKIRGLASQGMLVDADSSFFGRTSWKEEEDLALELNITKYEPPVKGNAQTQGKRGRVNKGNPLFHKYNGLDNIKWFPTLFQENELVNIQEKLHGTNARASIMPYYAGNWWKKLKKFLRLSPQWENCYGSNNVDISAKLTYNGGFYGEDVYGAVFKKMDVFSKLQPGESIYGEICGPGIQAGYEYGLTEHKFYLFDVKKMQPDGSQKWLSPGEVWDFAKERGFDTVPSIYLGPYNKELAYNLTKGASYLDSKTKVREGIVIKSLESYDIEGNKRALKWVSEDYLADDKNTDFH